MTTILIILTLVISVAVNVLLFTRKKDRKPQNISVRSTILAGIQNVSELATVRESFQSIVTFSEGVKIPFLSANIPGTTRKFMLKYNGTIVCGCDLSKAQVSENVNNKVIISLPHSEITDIYADMNTLEVYDQHAGIFTSIKLEDQNREILSDLEKVKAHEIERGILAHSDENARKVLSSVASATGVQAEIIFTEKTTPTLSSSTENIISIPENTQ